MKNENGITFIALVVTVIIMLILVSVSISYIIGENNILDNAKQVVIGTEKEKIELAVSEALQGYSSSNGYRGRGQGVDTYLISMGYIEAEPFFCIGKSGYYRINIDTLLEDTIETGYGLEAKKVEGVEDCIKDFYYIEVQQVSDEVSNLSAKINLRYIDKNGNGYPKGSESEADKPIYEYTETYNIEKGIKAEGKEIANLKNNFFDVKVEELEDKETQIDSKINDIDDKINDLKDKIKDLGENEKVSESDIVELNGKIKVLKDRIDNLKSEIKDLRKNLDKNETNNMEIEIGNLGSEVEDIESEIEELEKELKKLENLLSE